MPSGTRPALPKPKKAGRERGNSLEHFAKADISIEDQLKYRRHLLTANQNFVGFNKENLDIIAISFEHLCFSEAENKKEYKAKIRAKLREWNYEDFSEDEVDETPQSTGHSSEPMQTTTAITGENLSFVPSNSTPGSFIHRTPSEATGSRIPTPHSTGSTASKGSSKLGRSSSSRPRLPSPPQQSFSYGSPSPVSASTLFDPITLDRINLNDPASRAAWVEAVWHYFSSGGRPPPQPQSNPGRLRSSSFASMPSPASPTTPTMSHYQPLTVPDQLQHQQQQGGGEYEAMEGLETYYQEGHQQDNMSNLGQMVETLSPGSLSFVQEQWQKMQDQDIGNS